MPLTERITRVDELRSWKDQIPFLYEYTAGVAGEAFLRGLQEGKILAGECAKCGTTYAPPKIYCVKDFSEVRRFKEVKSPGRVSALAESHVSFDGKRTKEGKTFVFVTFEGATGGIVHLGLGGGLKIGSSVVPAFRPARSRKGSILDIEGFRKA